uniref:Uncharacterized protein n=1 Tax=Sus scrofa TaxID=9823 RepID=A0A4X1VAI2_PIG
MDLVYIFNSRLEIPINQILISCSHIYSSIFCLFVFGCTHSMWKFPGQGWNPCHSSVPGRCSDNTRSLTCYITRELLYSSTLNL